MKKFFAALCFALLLAMPSFGAQRTLDGAVLKEITVNFNPAPAYFYNGIYYLPANDYVLALLSLKNVDGQIEKAEENATDSVSFKELSEGTLVADSDAEYPEYACIGDEVFFALTYSNAQRLGLTLDLKENGDFFVYGNSKFTVYSHNGLAWDSGWETNTDTYGVNGKNCVRINYWSRRFFRGNALYVSYDGGEFTTVDDMRFVAGYSDILEMNADTAKIFALYSKDKTNGIIVSKDETYELTLDIPTATITEAKLTNKVERDVHGFVVDKDGNVDTSTLYSEDDYLPYAFYSGGKVILNGTMMRSYNVFYYIAEYGDKAFPVAIFGSTHNGFICAEDLVNYGYEMSVDYENHITYLSRNPSKEIKPMSFEGTNEQLPIYDSDWKIVIDGREIHLGFNIGGYTLISVKELGECEEGVLDENYRVTYVTTPDMVQPPEYVRFTEKIDDVDDYTKLLYTETEVSADATVTAADSEALSAVGIKYYYKENNGNVYVYALVRQTPELKAIAADSEKTEAFTENLVWFARTHFIDGIVFETDGSDTAVERMVEKISADTRIDFARLK